MQLSRETIAEVDFPETDIALMKSNTIHLFGLDLLNMSYREVSDLLLNKIANLQKTRVSFINAHCINIATSGLRYRETLRSSDVLLPDGSGIALAARLNGGKIVSNLNGTDFIPYLCKDMAQMGYSVYLLGGRPGVAEKAAEKLKATIPGLTIAGYQDGYFNEEKTPDVIAEINATKADLLLVAMGVPMQELWLKQHEEALSPSLLIGVGGLFDFLSGRISRAPMLLRNLGAEWMWRLYKEPLRMWTRYIYGNPIFVIRAIWEAMLSRVRFSQPVEDFIKRTIDIMGSGLMLIGLLLPFTLLGILIKINSPGPVFFTQTRIGRYGRPFVIYKFRSMYLNSVHATDEAGKHLEKDQIHKESITYKSKNDPRVTSIGRFIRKFSIDELPQIWNVFNGSMTFVGPRPHLPKEVELYDQEHHSRLAVTPGITCIWQISGRSNLPFKRQYELDMEYIQNRSFLLDMKILLDTIPVVIKGDGAY